MAMATLARSLLPASSSSKPFVSGCRFSEQTKAVPFFVDHLDSFQSSVKFSCFAIQFSDYQEARCSCRCNGSLSEPFNFAVSTSNSKSNHGIQCSKRSIDARSKQLLSHNENAPTKETQDVWSEEGNDDDDSSSLSNDGLGFDDSSFSGVDGSNSYFNKSDRASENGSAGVYKVPSRENSNSSPNVYVDSVIPVKEPIYEVLEVCPAGNVVKKSVSRRQLLKSSGLRLRDVRSVDPSLWVTNSAPALLVRDQAILLNLGSLRAIGTTENVLIFDHKSIGAVLFLEVLLQRLNPESNPGVPTMPFELEVVESALLSRAQRLERRLMEIEPRVLSLLEVLPNRLTANALEELRLSKQTLVELGSKAGALRQMLLELLESPQEIRKMSIMGRRCSIKRGDGSIDCAAFSEKQLADDEEEEIEMLLENYLQRCESCHGQAERLLDSAKEMEDSIAVNLSSRRLEVSKLELLLQVGTFCSALGALVAGIFGMNLRSYLETSAVAFWLTTAGIIFGGIIMFYLMFNYLKKRKIL